MLEIIVVDNCSLDGSREMLAQDFPEIQCVRNETNMGFSKANNIGVALSKGDYLLILNPDTMIAEHTLAEMLHFSEQQANFGAAGVQFIDGSGNFLPESKRNFPNLKVAGAKLLGYSKYYYANHLQQDEVAEVSILTGAFMFIKKAVYELVGGFDEDFFMYGEDIDLSYRISKAGYKNYYIGTSKVLHFKGECTVKDAVYLNNFYGALRIFYKKHFPHNTALYSLIQGSISAMISIKSLRGNKGVKPTVGIDSWAYVGSNNQLFERLQLKFPADRILIARKASKDLKDYDTIFLDSSFLTYKELIDVFSLTFLTETKKRIVSRDATFYLGSDHSDERGEVIRI